MTILKALNTPGPTTPERNPMSQESLHIIKDDQPPLKSATTAMIAAAATSGIGLSGNQPFVHAIESDETGQPKRTVVWCLADTEIEFAPNFPDERITTAEFVRRFRDVAWRKANPDHPIAYMAWYAENLSNLRTQIRESKPLLMIRRGRKVAFIPQDCPPERREKILSLL
jgi:hypothetical protein